MPSGSRSVGPFGEAVAAILKDATHSRDTRLQVIGDHAGLSVAQVSRMLNGQKVITLDEYVSICESLKLDPEKVFAEARLAQTSTPPQPAPADDGVVVTGRFPAAPPPPPAAEKAAARGAKDRPEWEAMHQWDDVGEESQVRDDEDEGEQ